MAFNINDILSVSNGVGGLTKPSKFLVRITRKDGQIDRTLPFLCNATTLPGIQILVSEYSPQTYGVKQKRPTGVNFQDLPLTFYSDNQGNVFNYFHSWINQVATFNSLSDNNRYLLAYPDEYRGTVEIILYDDSQNTVVSFKLNEAFPYTVDATPIAWDQSDQLLRFNVTFTFTNWSTEKLDITTIAHDFDINNNTSVYYGAGSNQNFYSLNQIINPISIISNPLAQTVQNVANIVNIFSSLLR